MSSRLIANALVAAAKRTPLSRGLGRKFTLSLLKTFQSGPVKSRFRGVPFLFHLDNNTEKKALMSDRYDKPELDFLENELSGRPCVFVDIGANSGLYSLVIASRLVPGSRVLAIEPNPVLCGRIKTNIALLENAGLGNGVRIDIEASAVAAEDGDLYLNAGAGPGVANIVSSDVPECIKVPAKRLSVICDKWKITHIDAMKVDVEGYEDRALIPFFKEAPSPVLPEVLLFEVVHSDVWQADVVLACKDAGYRELTRTRSCVLLRKSR